jgi:hypothetical protein
MDHREGECELDGSVPNSRQHPTESFLGDRDNYDLLNREFLELLIKS